MSTKLGTKSLGWFMHEVQTISIRNIIKKTDFSTQLSTVFCTISVNNDVILSSSRLEEGANLSWSTAAFSMLPSSMDSNYNDSTVITVSLHKLTNDSPLMKENEVVSPSYLQFTIDLNALRLLCTSNKLSTEPNIFPTNSLLFITDNYVYLSESTYNNMKCETAVSPPSSLPTLMNQASTTNTTNNNTVSSRNNSYTSIVDTTSYPSFEIDEINTQIINIQHQISVINHQIETYQSKLITSYNNAQKLYRMRCQRIQLLENEKLKLEVLVAEHEVELEEQAEQQEVQALYSTQNLQHEVDVCDQINIQIMDLNDKIQKQKHDLLKIQFLMESRQLTLIYDLYHIYPIEKSIHTTATSSSSGASNYSFGTMNTNITATKGSTSEYTIRGLDLNEFNSNSRDDDTTSSALGYLVHLCLLISKYLDCPLRYQLIYNGSRSFIRDPLANPFFYGQPASSLSGVSFPLYRKGTEKERYDTAIQWLRSNIQQILSMTHIEFNVKETMLYNMYMFFQKESS